MRTLTLGESRVRMTFNPSNNTMVDQIKAKTAELIDLCETLRKQAQNTPVDVQGGDKAPEMARCCALAQTNFETAAMYAVKAATA